MEEIQEYEGQKHFEIIFKTGQRRGLCNPKQIKKPSKLTDNWEKVTCANCLIQKDRVLRGVRKTENVSDEEIGEDIKTEENKVLEREEKIFEEDFL